MGDRDDGVENRCEARGQPPFREESFQQHRITANCTPRDIRQTPRATGQTEKQLPARSAECFRLLRILLVDFVEAFFQVILILLF